MAKYKIKKDISLKDFTVLKRRFIFWNPIDYFDTLHKAEEFMYTQIESDKKKELRKKYAIFQSVKDNIISFGVKEYYYVNGFGWRSTALSANYKTVQEANYFLDTLVENDYTLSNINKR